MGMDEKQEWMDEYSKTFNPPLPLVFPLSGCNCTRRRKNSSPDPSLNLPQVAHRLFTLEPCAQGELLLTSKLLARRDYMCSIYILQ